MKETIAVGLDIGTTKIVAMIGKRNEYGKLEILGYGNAKSAGVYRGVIRNINEAITSIQEAVSIAEEDSGYKIKQGVVGIAGQHIRSIQHTDYISRNQFEEVITEDEVDTLTKQVESITMLPGEEIINVIPQEYKVNGEAEITNPVGMYGNRLEASFHVVVGQGASIRNIGKCIKSADVDLDWLTLEPLASAEAVLTDEEKEEGVALIDMGGGTTDLAIFKGGIIRHTAVIPFGGNVITDDIADACLIPKTRAEQLKIRYGSAWPGENKEHEIVAIPGVKGRDPKEISLKNLSKIIHGRVVEIFENVFEEIKIYGHTEPKKKLICGIVLTGGGAELKHIKQLVEYITGLDTRIGYPNEHLAGSTSEELSSPLYATSVGLVMESLRRNNVSAVPMREYLNNIAKPETPEIVLETKINEPVINEPKEEPTEEKNKVRKGIFDKFIDKLKDFLDKAE